jgi:hypothetical protein
MFDGIPGYWSEIRAWIENGNVGRGRGSARFGSTQFKSYSGVDLIMHPHAQAAVHAAKIYLNVGRFASLRYAQKRGCPDRLYYLSRMLEAAKMCDKVAADGGRRSDGWTYASSVFLEAAKMCRR